jgi:hypothetical protein
MHVHSVVKPNEHAIESALSMIGVFDFDISSEHEVFNEVFHNAIVCFKAFYFMVGRSTPTMISLKDIFLFAMSIGGFYEDLEEVSNFFVRYYM